VNERMVMDVRMKESRAELATYMFVYVYSLPAYQAECGRCRRTEDTKEVIVHRHL
jgi:hypothetical protein